MGIAFCPDEYGNFGTRCTSFLDLLSINRVGTFINDRVIFAAFQGCFVDNNLMRRGDRSAKSLLLRNTVKFVSFFGLVAYLTLHLLLPMREMD